MVDELAPLLLGSRCKDGTVEWKVVGEESTLTTAQVLTQNLHESHELAITGDPTMHALEADGTMAQLLMSIRIFARMTPDGKVRVIKLLQAIASCSVNYNYLQEWCLIQGQGLAVGMTGDGGNDCGALRVMLISQA